MAVTIGQVIALIKALAGGGGGGSGGVSDVKVNGTSVVTSGVANVPLATANNLGVVKPAGMGIAVNSNNGEMYIVKATTEQVKAATTDYRSITPSCQHESTFYGLAKLAGADMSSSSNAVGTYTENAKSGIHEMLNAPETVSGTTPSITAKAGVRYICGEVSTISITAPASGCIDVVFESGSTATVMTLASAKTGVTAIKFPSWFDPDNLEANKTYEINILDGEFGAVMSWA